MAMDIYINRDTQEVEIRFNAQVITRKIWKDEEEREYFSVPNLLNNPAKITNQSFNHRVKDAVDTIRNGDGDVILRLKSFGLEKVIRYLDRDYGEKVREQFFEGWKNVKFAHIVLASGCFTLDIKGNITSEPHQFETQEQAEKYLCDIFTKISDVFKKYDVLSEIELQKLFELISSEGKYSFAEKEYLHYLIEKAFTGSARFPFKIAQITF